MRLRHWTAIQSQIPIARPGSHRCEQMRAISRWLASCSHRFSDGLVSPSAGPGCWHTSVFAPTAFVYLPYPPLTFTGFELGEDRSSEACPEHAMSWKSFMPRLVNARVGWYGLSTASSCI